MSEHAEADIFYIHEATLKELEAKKEDVTNEKITKLVTPEEIDDESAMMVPVDMRGLEDLESQPRAERTYT